MGNREKLLDGALECLLAKGYAATTARDIATAAGVSLAAINYHFRTTEALLDEALRRALERWSEELERALTGEGDAPADPQDRFEAVWTRVINSVTANRPLWTTQFEIVTSLGRQDAPESSWTAAQETAYAGLAALFHGVDPSADPGRAHTVGAFYHALLTGVVVQHLTVPAHAMSAADLIAALREISPRFAAA